jgi:3-hydroxybutyrate dehydrogenase
MGGSKDTVNTLHGRVAIVTGASRGIGAEVARHLAEAGLKVALVARSRDAIESLAREIGGVAVASDVTEKGSSEAILREVEARLGPVSVVVPNAGIESSFKIEATSDEAWESVMAVNATSVFRLCRAALPGMMKRDYGRIVVVASSAGLVGFAYTAAYCASKHAVIGLVRAIAAEIATTPVTINAVCPGFVDTSMTDRSIARIVEKTGRDAATAKGALERLSPQKRLIEPVEVAHAVVSLLAPAARGIHGQAIAINGGGING